MPNPLDHKKVPDRINALYKADGARVSVELEEKLSGPANSYSSVTVRIAVGARCAQTEDSIRKMTQALHAECQRALSHYVPPSMELLIAHINHG